MHNKWFNKVSNFHSDTQVSFPHKLGILFIIHYMNKMCSIFVEYWGHSNTGLQGIGLHSQVDRALFNGYRQSNRQFGGTSSHKQTSTSRLICGCLTASIHRNSILQSKGSYESNFSMFNSNSITDRGKAVSGVICGCLKASINSHCILTRKGCE